MVTEDSESSQSREVGKRRQWKSKLDTEDTHERSLQAKSTKTRMKVAESHMHHKSHHFFSSLGR